MTTRVDPFVQPIPEQFLRDRTLRTYFEYLHKVIHDLRARTGGDDDQVTNLGVRELYPYTQRQEGGSIQNTSLFSRPVSQESLGQSEYFSVSSNHATAGNEIIEATAALTVTLNSTPELLEAVSVKRNGSGVVTIAGTIDGETNFELLYNLESVDLIYNGSEWIII